jgi:hypothetical protein
MDAVKQAKISAMDKRVFSPSLTRRRLLQMSSAATASLALPTWLVAAEPQSDLYASLLQTWCDGLLARQLTAIDDPALHGALMCPSCAMIHGRCGDALYPLIQMAHTTGEMKYLQAAVMLYNWTEQNVSRPDGSWINDVLLSSWQGITVFHSIALAEALHHHGNLLIGGLRERWMARLAKAAKFLDGFISIETGNINYPITSCYAFALFGELLSEPRYTERGRKLAHEVLGHFTENGFIAGEGHPLDGVSAKHCRPVDLGYNVEESLPALTLYSLLTKDEQVLDQTMKSLRTHLEFMLPDGAWDNSWGTRNYKWSWWGSRTSDGCQPGYALLGEREPKFREAAYRNLELMAACTHDGLLYGGPDYKAHGEQACIHHTFTHAKALATVLDRGAQAVPSPRLRLPRDEAYGLKSYPEIGTHLAAIGEWRATVTEYDWEYVEHVQQGSGNAGGHVSGGALSMLYHRVLGPVTVASMTEYQIIEMSNQQIQSDAPHMPLTPRVEVAGSPSFASTNDLHAMLSATNTSGEIVFEAKGKLLTAGHQELPDGGAEYRMKYRLTPSMVELSASCDAAKASFVLPVVCRQSDAVERVDAHTIRIARPTGALIVRTDASQGFMDVPQERTFNLVPGFEAAPITIAMKPGETVSVKLEVELKK